MTNNANEESLKPVVIKRKEVTKGNLKKLRVPKYVCVSVKESNETDENHPFSTIENMDDEMIRGIYIPTHEVFTRNSSDRYSLKLRLIEECQKDEKKRMIWRQNEKNTYAVSKRI